MTTVSLQTRITLRRDDLSNWITTNPVLLDGEIAIVTDSEGNENIKIGNGLSTFTQLDFYNQKILKTEKLQTKNIETKSISQGYHTDSTPTSMATGIFTKAQGQFGVVHGIEGQILSTDNYSFLYNGVNLPLDNENFYKSHGEGTFNVNPVKGLSGFYVGENTLDSEFQKKSKVTIRDWEDEEE